MLTEEPWRQQNLCLCSNLKSCQLCTAGSWRSTSGAADLMDLLAGQWGIYPGGGLANSLADSLVKIDLLGGA